MKNLKERFVDYLLETKLYSQYLDSREKCEGFVSELETEYQTAFGAVLLNESMNEGALADEIRENLKRKAGTSFESFCQRRSSGAPHAILNSHLIPFLIKENEKKFNGQGASAFHDLLKNLVDAYDSFINEVGGLEANDELYKWELIGRQQGHPDVNAEDFEDEIKKLRFSLNGEGMLCYAVQVAAIRNFAKYAAEEYRGCFVPLFDESVDLQQRVDDFIARNKSLWNQIKSNFSGKTSALCDERLVSCFLTFRYPDRYSFYKDGVYRAFCSYLGIEPRKAGKKMVHFYELLSLLIDEVKGHQDLVDFVNRELDDKGFLHSWPLLAQDILWQLTMGVLKINLDVDQFEDMEEVALLKQKKQIILQGAPGTGKTYKTAELAVALCDNVNTRMMKREDIMSRYNQLFEEGRIALTTFHQSLDYEEFVEGIRAEVDDEGKIFYQVEDGIFKRICKRAAYVEVKDKKLVNNENPTIWKVSLQGTGDNPTRSDCMKNNRIRIGWDQYGEHIDDTTDYKNGGKFVLDAFMNKMAIGDYVFSCYSARTIDAIGVVTGEYEWLEGQGPYQRSRKVEWLVKGIEKDIYELNNNTLMTLSSCYKLNNIDFEKLNGLLQEFNVQKVEYKEEKRPYVLIIDEINRGNVSKIFGELITLLEADKRRGEENAVKAVLPYSHEHFMVPGNLFIIGTMNTADRSLGNIDYAVRRRFAFVTLFSERRVVEAYYTDDDLRDLALGYFDEVNDLMEVPSDYDKNDIMIGHSYFLAKNEMELRNKMVYEVRPLLLEYVNDGLLNISKGDDEYKRICDLGK